VPYVLLPLCRSAWTLTLFAIAWATRTLIVRKLKGLEDLIRKRSSSPVSDSRLRRFAHSAVTIVSPHMGTEGWPFANVDEFPGAEVDPLYGSEHIKDLYFKADPNYTGR
jgi:putative glutathione S-transferase